MCRQSLGGGGLFEAGMDLAEVRVELDILYHRLRITIKSGGIFLTIAITCIVSQMVLFL